MQLQRTKTLVLLALVALVMALAACTAPAANNTDSGNTGGATATTPDASTGGTAGSPVESTPASSTGTVGDLQGAWTVSTINGNPVGIESVPTVIFDGNGKVTGNATCNGYGGDYKSDGSSLMITGVVSTLMACADDALNQQESAFTGALEQVATYTIDGTTLTFMDADGNTIMELSRAA